jgi:hypothetical protein
MLSSKIIIIILSLYSLVSTSTYITYIIKYNNLKHKYTISKSNNLRKSNLLNNTSNNPNLTISYPNPEINFNNLSNIISKYDIYYDTDFYNNYDLIDESNDNIIIYSRDLLTCYKECENNNKCYGKNCEK